MPQTTCPYGSEMNPTAEAVYQVSQSVLNTLFGWLTDAAKPIWSTFVGKTFDLPTFCATAHPGYPTITASDFTNFSVLAAKIEQWLNAWVWDSNCQCQTEPGG